MSLSLAGRASEGANRISGAPSLALRASIEIGAMLQVYARTGELLNEAPLGRLMSRFTNDRQLIEMGNGYLFSDRQLVWVGAGPDRHVWRFGPSLARTMGDRWGDRWRYFGDPLVSDSCLFVTGRDVQLFVFDVNRVTRKADEEQKK